MNKVTLRKSKELLFYLILTILLTYGAMLSNVNGLQGAVLFFLVLIAYRYGFVTVYSIGVLYGVISGFLAHVQFKTDLILMLVMYCAIGVMSTSVGLFAKNIHRTLNNKRYSSVWLNVVTSATLVSIILYIISIVVNQPNVFHWLNAGVYLIVVISLTMVLAYSYPKAILTKRSIFLSNKERSKLLND